MADQRSTRSNGHYASGEVSVTTVLRVLDKPALRVWMCKKTFEATMDGARTFSETQKYVRSISEKAMNIGTMIHDYVERYDTGNQAEIDPEQAKYYQAFHDWITDYRPEFIERELTVTSKEYGYKGTVDMIVMLDGKKCIVDLKTGKSIYESVELQTSAYKQAYEEQFGEEIEDTYCLLLEKGGDGFPTGRYKFERKKYRPEVFNALLIAYNWLNEK